MSDCCSVSVQVLELKTRVLEAIEELHIHRDAETRYEEDICKLVLEKQDLEWQKESLQNEVSKMTKEHSEALDAVKKQFQTEIRRIEGEKEKSQLDAELKEKEISSLKEEIKQLQVLRYSSEKKSGELEQKLQLQAQTKDSHLNQLSEVERRFHAVSRQCAAVKLAHDKLEHNVGEAIRMNKKITSVNQKQESTTKSLLKDMERLNTELAKAKVSSACKPGEERVQNTRDEQQLQHLQHRLLVETEMNKKLKCESVTARTEKQEVLKTLTRTQTLLKMQTEALRRAELELSALREDHQVLKTEHEVHQQRSKAEAESFSQLREHFQNSQLAWENQIQLLQKSSEKDQMELSAVREAYDELQEKHQSPSPHAALNTKNTQSTEFQIALEVPQRSPCVELTVSPEDPSKPTCHLDEPVPGSSFPHADESAAASPRPENGEQIVDAEASVLEPDVWASVRSGDGGEGVASANQQTEAQTGDKGCPTSPSSSDPACLAQLSGPETSSVYQPDADPKPNNPPPELNTCPTEAQTPDKHRLEYATSHETLSRKICHSQTQPESTTESSTDRKRDSEASEASLQEVNGICDPIDTQMNPCPSKLHQDLDSVGATVDSPSHESKDPCDGSKCQFQPREDQLVEEIETDLEIYQVNHVNHQTKPCWYQPQEDQVEETEPDLERTHEDDTKLVEMDLVRSRAVKVVKEAPDQKLEDQKLSTGPSDVSPNGVSRADSIKHSSIRHSSFSWNTFPKQKNTQWSSQDNLWPSGFPERGSSFGSRLVNKSRAPKRAMLRFSDGVEASKNPHNSQSSKEWSAIKETFSKILAENESQVLISFNPPVNELRQACAGSPSRPQSLEKEAPHAAKASTSTSQAKAEKTQFNMKGQMLKIEELMTSEGLMPPKRCKTD